jgi:hypothetical protein
MKKILYTGFLLIQLMVVPCFLNSVFADPPGPPDPGGDPGGSGGLPVGAPIDNAVIVLIALGVFYGGYKLYRIWKAKQIAAESEGISAASAATN